MPTMNDATERPPLPDHLSSDPRSKHHVAEVFQHAVGIRPIWGYMAALVLGLIVVAVVPWLSVGFLER